MFVMLLAFALSDPDAREAPPPTSAATVPCRATAQLVANRDAPARMRTLAEEPPAQEYPTVLRIENGCAVPVKVSERVIGNPPLR